MKFKFLVNEDSPLGKKEFETMEPNIRWDLTQGEMPIFIAILDRAISILKREYNLESPPKLVLGDSDEFPIITDPDHALIELREYWAGVANKKWTGDKLPSGPTQNTFLPVDPFSPIERKKVPREDRLMIRLHLHKARMLEYALNLIDQHDKMYYQRSEVISFKQELDAKVKSMLTEYTTEKVVTPLFDMFLKMSTDKELTEEEIMQGVEIFIEGKPVKVTVNRYERSQAARQACIDYYGYDCYTCGFNFENEFGERGKNFIEVHHLIPISEIGEEYEINPRKDMRPVCPNCHAMLDKGMSIEEVIAAKISKILVVE